MSHQCSNVFGARKTVVQFNQSNNRMKPIENNEAFIVHRSFFFVCYHKICMLIWIKPKKVALRRKSATDCKISKSLKKCYQNNVVNLFSYGILSTISHGKSVLLEFNLVLIVTENWSGCLSGKETQSISA